MITPSKFYACGRPSLTVYAVAKSPTLTITTTMRTPTLTFDVRTGQDVLALSHIHLLNRDQSKHPHFSKMSFEGVMTGQDVLLRSKKTIQCVLFFQNMSSEDVGPSQMFSLSKMCHLTKCFSETHPLKKLAKM